MRISRKEKARDRASAAVGLCDMAWQAVYGEGRTDWESLPQAVRHLISAWRDAKERIRVLEQIAATAYSTAEWRTKHRTEEMDWIVSEVWGRDGWRYDDAELEPGKEEEASGERRENRRASGQLHGAGFYTASQGTDPADGAEASRPVRKAGPGSEEKRGRQKTG